jgi:hypothetical protein
MGGAVSRLTNGISTAMPDGLWGDYRWPGAHDFYEYKNDFSTYAAGDWTVTSTNSGTSALADGEGGLLVQTTGATSTNYQANQLAAKSFYMVTGYRHWFWMNFNLSDIAHTLLLAGWVDTLAGPMTPASGVYFSKTDASATLNIILNNAGTKTTVAVGTIAAATAYTVGWYYDGKSTPTLSVFSTIGQTLPVKIQGHQVYGGQIVASIGANSPTNTSLANLPAATIGHTMAFGITTGASAAHTNTVDYVGSASMVNRF